MEKNRKMILKRFQVLEVKERDMKALAFNGSVTEAVKTV